MWRVERFDGVFGGWYVTNGMVESRIYLIKILAVIVAWYRNLRAGGKHT